MKIIRKIFALHPALFIAMLLLLYSGGVALARLSHPTESLLDSLLVMLDTDLDGDFTDETWYLNITNIDFIGSYTVSQIAGLSPSTGDVIRVTDGDSACDTTTGSGTYISEHRFDGTNWICIGDGGGGSGAGDWTAQTSAPSHGVQPFWRVDPASFNPCSSTDTTDYWVFDDGTDWQPLWELDGTPIIQTAVPVVPREGWHYWFENTTDGGADDPNDEDEITGAYRTIYADSAYVTDMTADGTAVISPNQPAPTPTIGDPDSWTLTGYGFWIANAAGSASLPAVAIGMNGVVSVRGSYVAVIDPDGTEEIFLNGVTCGAGVSIQSEGDGDGERVTLQYSASGDWDAVGYGWECTP